MKGSLIFYKRSAKELLNLCHTNGGVYIKLGQHVASLVYLVPKEYTEILSSLQDECPVSSFDDINQVFEHETGQEILSVFSEFDPIPIGSVLNCFKLIRLPSLKYTKHFLKIIHP